MARLGDGLGMGGGRYGRRRSGDKVDGAVARATGGVWPRWYLYTPRGGCPLCGHSPVDIPLGEQCAS